MEDYLKSDQLNPDEVSILEDVDDRSRWAELFIKVLFSIRWLR